MKVVNAEYKKLMLNQIRYPGYRKRKKSTRRLPTVPTINDQEPCIETHRDSPDLDSSTSSVYDDNLLDGNCLFL